MWYLRNLGLWGTAKFVASKIANPSVTPGKKVKHGEKDQHSIHEETLYLRPGELVEVKSENEIIKTLDEKRRHNGLMWLVGMSKCCGKNYRVLKRVETIRLEGKPETRRMKNTVLLEGAMCDGSEYYGCDRSCFYFWHEAWLRRVKEDADSDRQQKMLFDL
jgi:hypothetical protein